MQPAVEGLADAADGLVEGVGAVDGVVNGAARGGKRDLHVVEAGGLELADVGGVCQAAPVGIEARDLTVRFGMVDQLGQVRVQRCLASGEDDVRDADVVKAIEDTEPGLGAERWHIEPIGFVVAMRAMIRAAVGDGKVGLIGRRGAATEEGRLFQIW